MTDETVYLLATVAVPVPLSILPGETRQAAIARLGFYYECGTWCGGNLGEMLTPTAPMNEGPCGCETVLAVTVVEELPPDRRCTDHPSTTRRNHHMKLTIELDVEHVDGTGRDDPERVADIAYYQLLDRKQIDAGTGPGDALYQPTGYRLVSSEPETDDAGTDLDVLPG